ncbi:hypothetical protein HPB48_017999 [Haemaphysalis longicornis]|uniref:Uncharacterized protein n=1 Tax=Haemaphysalis longicornis TaxID=44386 RepID=A0A9J6FHE7_HAELO|nr:hypothetical protein HPB48_017999 [Haemaphysalis longicornis]
MAVKLVVLCAVLSVNWEVSGARVNILETKHSSSGRHFVSAQNNAQLCNYQQLAKTYTLCSVPFYADFISDTFGSRRPSCSPLEKFQACLAASLEETRCANDTSLLTPTIKYFTRSVLHPYRKMCNITSEIPTLTPLPEITIVTRSKNQTSLHNGTSIKSNATADSSKRSLVETNQTSAFQAANRSSHQTQAPPSVKTSRRTLDDINGNSSALGKNITLSGATNVSNATKKILSAGANVSGSGSPPLKKLMNDDNCDVIDKHFKYPDTCVKNWLLRRMFTCGVAMFEFILHNQSQICQCVMNYRQCVANATVELNCTTSNNMVDSKDPIMATVKLIESLMLAWYQNPCAIYDKPARGRVSEVTSDVCDANKASVASVVCYATYFAMNELKTPAPWTSHNDACSAFNDAQRCLIVAQHKNNCTEAEFTQHSRRFLTVITSGKHRHCPVDAGFPKVQALGAFVKPGCQRSKALRRALQCAISFQDFADTERAFSPPQPVPCGHVSRLHACLEDSVEGTGCYGDISVHSEIKVYKKVLEDAYDVRCLVEAPPEIEARARGLQRGLSPYGKGVPIFTLSQAYKKASGSSEFRNWRIDLGLYDKSAENVGYYYDESVDGHKQVFAGPRIVATHPDDLDEESDYALYQKAPDSAASGWRPLAQKMQDRPAAPAALAEAAANSSNRSVVDSAPRTVLQFFTQAAAFEVSKNRTANALRVEEHKDPKKAPSKPDDDYIFASDYMENSGLAMFPNGIDMFRHFRGGALARMDSVIAANQSAEFSFLGDTDCSLDKVRLALRLCNSTLSGLLLRWPNITDIGLPLDTSSAGVKHFCSDLNTYRGCLAAVLKTYDCSQSQAINGVFEVYRKKLRLPYCASSASWNRAAIYTVFAALLTTLVEKQL